MKTFDQLTPFQKKMAVKHCSQLLFASLDENIAIAHRTEIKAVAQKVAESAFYPEVGEVCISNIVLPDL